MTIQIGDQALDASRPADLDRRLVASTGCNAAEHVAMLSNPARGATPLQIAKALAPMLATAIPVAKLAEQIAAADVVAIRQQVIALLKQETPNGEAPVVA